MSFFRFWVLVASVCSLGVLASCSGNVPGPMGTGDSEQQETESEQADSDSGDSEPGDSAQETTASDPGDSEGDSTPSTCGDGSCDESERCDDCVLDCGECPVDTESVDDIVDASTMDRKIMAGYQGWFNAEGDGAGVGWRHWTRQKPNPDNIQFDMWPDMSELDDDELYQTDFSYSDGSNAGLYSAYNEKTVVRHVKWMEDYGIDGVYVQRFICEAIDMRKHRDKVLESVRIGSELHGRVFANMYDISCGKSETLVNNIKEDWMHLVDDIGITESERYLHHNGRPVLSIWGFNATGRPGTPAQAMEIVTWLTETAPDRYRVTLMLGQYDTWTTDAADWQKVYDKADVISPWSVGRYRTESGANDFLENKVKPDLVECTKRNLRYMPVVFPGFSWVNLKDKEFNLIPRNGGKFFWRQIFNVIGAGSSMVYVAMFDEVDEGTAIYKIAPTEEDTPTAGLFVTLDEDGYVLPSDWYLRLTGQASKMLRGDIELTSTIPIMP